MKKIKFLAVALAAFTMFSCTNDEVENLGNNVPRWWRFGLCSL